MLNMSIQLPVTLLSISNVQSAATANEIVESDSKMLVILLIACAFLAIFGLIFVVRAFRELKKQYKIIESQHDEIAEKNKELAFKNEALEELNMEKNNMISVVAHDLKAPLGNIEGLVELIRLNKDQLTKDQEEYLDMLKKVAKDTAQMVDIMLNVHRIESEQHQLALHEYSANELIEKVVRLHEPAMKLKNGKITFNAEPEAIQLNTDKQYFQQIISTVLQNAVDFSPKNTAVKLSLSEDDNYVRVVIKDYGPGISEEHIARIFSGYTTLEDGSGQTKSTGIGLAIAQRLLEKLHGRIDVSSEPGQGSTFTIDFIK
jgi:two-component system sensor histidine kinase/response regulator